MDQSSLGTLLKWGNSQLISHSESASLDARVLLQHITALSHAELISHADDGLESDKEIAYRNFIRLRCHGTPVAYITGIREFWSLSFNVSTATLIPRPDTELLVERTLKLIHQDQSCTVADIGTGCGTIALALAHEHPITRIVATDISTEALTVARHNAESLNISNVEFRHGDLLSPLEDKSCDIIVSNPPYVCENDSHLDKGDVAFEPRSALVGGLDGLDYIRLLASDSPAKLKSHGWLLVEHGFDQAKEVRTIFEQKAFTQVESYRDLSGHERVTQGLLA